MVIKISIRERTYDHEGEEDEDSGGEIHQDLQHQDDVVAGREGLVFILVTGGDNLTLPP